RARSRRPGSAGAARTGPSAAGRHRSSARPRTRSRGRRGPRARTRRRAWSDAPTGRLAPRARDLRERASGPPLDEGRAARTAARGSGRERVPGLLALRAEGVEGLLETGGGDGLTLDGGLERRLDAVEVLLELGVREVLDGDEALARRVDRGGGLLVLGVLEERRRLGDEALGGVLAAVERVARGRHGDDGGRHLGGRLGRGRGLGGRRV